MLAKTLRYRLKNPAKIRHFHLMREYGVSIEAYNLLLCLQRHKCAVCGKPEERKMHGKVTPLVVDHDHETGEVRGLLCHQCNISLGGFRDDPLILDAARQYLDRDG
jgi:hypothetical protein